MRATREELGVTLAGGHIEITQGFDRPILVGQMLGEVAPTHLVRKTRIAIGDRILLTRGEAIIIVFLLHFRSALIPIITLPIAVIASFLAMYLRVSSNIMSLGGRALAIGVLVDAAIVMVENGYRHLSEHRSVPSTSLESNVPVHSSPIRRSPELRENERRRILIDAAKQVGPALFFSLVIIVVSFLPVFLPEAQEGRMFRRLPWTKTSAVRFCSFAASFNSGTETT